MHRLLLLRHAKSSWDTADLPDHDRPLARRGHQAVADLRRHFAHLGIAPDLVLCSNAKRAVETWEGVAPGCPPDTPVEFSPELYGSSRGELLQRLQQLPEAVRCALVVAHNPGLGELASGLVGSGDTDMRHRLETKFPTGALATLALPGPWAALRWGAAQLTGFVVPSELH